MCRAEPGSSVQTVPVWRYRAGAVRTVRVRLRRNAPATSAWRCRAARVRRPAIIRVLRYRGVVQVTARVRLHRNAPATSVWRSRAVRVRRHQIIRVSKNPDVVRRPRTVGVGINARPTAAWKPVCPATAAHATPGHTVTASPNSAVTTVRKAKGNRPGNAIWKLSAGVTTANRLSSLTAAGLRANAGKARFTEKSGFYSRFFLHHNSATSLP